MCKEYINLQTNKVLDLEKVSTLPDNAMLKVKSELWCEWDFEKNTLDIFKVTKGSERQAWWICSDCTESYDMYPYHRVKLNCKCPYCRGLRVGKFNNLQYKRPDIASQWHPTKNGDLTPNDVVGNSGQKVWWTCEKGHEWEAMVSDRNSGGKGCPYCKNKKTNSENCLNNTHPEIARYLVNRQIGEERTYGCTIKVDWICDKCNRITKNRPIHDVVKRGFNCSFCGDGISLPEKITSAILDDLGINYTSQKKFEWSDGKFYDFYFIKDNETYIIECHGMQHYEERTGHFGSDKTLAQEVENDKYKEYLASNNGINNYIVLDCRYSEIEYIKKSILNSEKMEKLINFELDWNSIFKNSHKSNLVNACELYSIGDLTITDIANSLNTSIQTVIKYLKEGTKLELCNYNPMSDKNKELAYSKISKSVVKLSIQGHYIETYKSSAEASRKNEGLRSNAISACCRGKLLSTGGYRWMFKSNYDESKNNNIDIGSYKRKQEKNVVQLTLDGDFICEYKNLSEAKESTGIWHSGITHACKGKYSQAGGYKWMYKEEYEKINNKTS